MKGPIAVREGAAHQTVTATGVAPSKANIHPPFPADSERRDNTGPRHGLPAPLGWTRM